MKDELEKKIRSICDEAGATARADEMVETFGHQYDARIRAGMSEIDAYRDVLRNLDRIQQAARVIRDTDEEIALRVHREACENLKFYLNKTSQGLWILTFIAFMILCLRGSARYAWILFPWTACGQLILQTVEDYNKKMRTRQSLFGGLSGLLWVGTATLFFVSLLIFHVSARYAWLLFPAAAFGEVLLTVFFDKRKNS